MNGATRFPLSLCEVSETTAKGTGLGQAAGKEDPVELDSSEWDGLEHLSQQGGSPARPLTGRADPLAH
jgi:hypothetical protein